MDFKSVNQPELADPLLAFRFMVHFLGNVGVAHPLDAHFSKVSGIGVRMDSETNSKKNDSLILERGMPVSSTLRLEILNSLQGERQIKRNVLVSILDENALPQSSWLFSNAFPVSWSLSSLDANSNEVIIEKIELQYEKVSPFSL